MDMGKWISAKQKKTTKVRTVSIILAIYYTDNEVL